MARTAQAMNETTESTLHTVTMPSIPCLLDVRAARIHPAPKQAVKNAICHSDIEHLPFVLNGKARTNYPRSPGNTQSHGALVGTW